MANKNVWVGTTQTNQYGQRYLGNDDFRGWLAAGGIAPGLDNDVLANGLLMQYAGNDGGVGTDDQEIADLARYNYDYWSSQRQAPATNPTADGNDNSSSAATDAAQKRAMTSYYDDIIKSKNDSLNNLSSSLQNELDRINGEYDVYRNEQQSAYNRARNNYDRSSSQNMDSLISNRNTIANNASQGLRGLMRVLGAMGAGGGSVARYNAPEAVKNQADKENANAGLTYAQNQQNLDTDWGNYQNEYENDKKKLEDWKSGQIKSAQQENEKQRIGLLEGLRDAYANRAIYNGGNLGDSSSINDRIQAANRTIQDLGRHATPNYTGTTAVYEAPNLSSYDTGQTSLATTVNNTGDSGNTPLLSMLRQLNRRKQTNPYNYETEE